MFDFDQIVPLDPRNPEPFMRKVAEFGEWISTLPKDCPLELHLTVGPFDSTVREWSYRKFTDEESSTMIPCHRIIVACLNIWGDNIEQMEYGTVQPPANMVNDPDFSWGDGVVTAVYNASTLFADAQTNYLGRVFREHNFDHDKFLEETESIASPQAIRDFLEAMLYVCELETLIKQNEQEPELGAHTSLMSGLAREMRDHMYRTWDEWKNIGSAPEQNGEVN